MHKILKRFAFIAVLALCGSVYAQDMQKWTMHNQEGVAPNPQELADMIAMARRNTPPRNGKKYVVGYTMWGASSSFSQLNLKGMRALAGAGDFELLVADNAWDPSKNIENTQVFATKNVDFVVNSLLDVQFGPAVWRPLKNAGIPLIALDIPVQGANWVGVDNAKAGFLAGTYLGQAAVNRWGPERVAKGYLVIAAFPLVGPNGKMRNLGEEFGFRSVIPELPDDHVIWLDMDGTPEGGFAMMNNLKGRLPADAPVMIASFSDEQLAGALRAMSQDGRTETIGVGMGGGRLDAVSGDPNFIGTVSSFNPTLYGNYAIPVGFSLLAGAKTPDRVYTRYDLVTPENLCRFDTNLPCHDLPSWQPAEVTINEDSYRSLVDYLYGLEDFQDFEVLLPPRN